MEWLRAFLNGEEPLPRSFWRYGIAYGFVLNATGTTTAMILIMNDGPNWLAAILYGLPIPYNLAALVGVWRSADRWDGEHHWATLARLAITAWMAAMTLF